MSEWRCFADTDQLDRALANHIAGQLALDIAGRGQASLIVSGGSTPTGMFAHLSQSAVDWSKVYIGLVDERWVSPNSPDSNERLVRENLLCGGAAAANFIGLKAEQPDARDAVTEVEQRLAEIPLPFSVVVLGMGGDGHTASWFPRAANLQDLLDPHGSHRLAATEPVTATHQRMTLTLPAVLDCCELIVHITGDEKKQVLLQAQENNYPIAAILEQDTNPVTIWWAP